MSVNIVDEDGKSIAPFPAIPVDVVVPGDATFISRNFVLNIQGLKFEHAGLYSVAVALNGRHETSIPLAVKQMPTQKGPPSQEM